MGTAITESVMDSFLEFTYTDKVDKNILIFFYNKNINYFCVLYLHILTSFFQGDITENKRMLLKMARKLNFLALEHACEKEEDNNIQENNFGHITIPEKDPSLSIGYLYIYYVFILIYIYYIFFDENQK